MRKCEQKSKDNYDKIADNYESTFDGKFTVKFKEELLKLISIPSGGTVLDIACGNGRFLKQLSNQADLNGSHTISMFGVDISEKMIVNAKQLNPSMNFYVAGCDTLPFDDNTINLITVCASFHHFPNIEKFAIETRRVIKSDGLIYIAEIYLPYIIRVLCNPFLKFSKAGDVKFYSPNEIVSLFENHGFIKDKVVIKGTMQIIVMRQNRLDLTIN